MVTYKKAPRPSIPDWLDDKLNTLHWQVATFYIDVGSPLREVINWLLGLLEDIIRSVDAAFIDLSDDLYNFKVWTQQGLQAALGLITDVDKRVTAVNNTLRSFMDGIDNIITERYEFLSEPLRDLTISLFERTEKLQSDVEALQGGWWTPANILDAIATSVDKALAPFKSLESERRNLFEWLWLIFSDPPLFFYELFDDIIERFW